MYTFNNSKKGLGLGKINYYPLYNEEFLNSVKRLIQKVKDQYSNIPVILENKI